jgi:hypothetical protein
MAMFASLASRAFPGLFLEQTTSSYIGIRDRDPTDVPLLDSRHLRLNKRLAVGYKVDFIIESTLARFLGP